MDHPKPDLEGEPAAKRSRTESTLKVGFIGGGQMARALIGGFLTAGVVKADNVIVSTPSEGSRVALSTDYGVSTTGNNCDVVAASDVVFLAVKPHIIGPVVEEISGSVGPSHLVVSIAAGVTLASIEGGLPEGTRVVRVMPNTPCLVGRMAGGFAAGSTATEEDSGLVEKLLNSVGIVHCVPERLLDAVCGLSGSGPAFVFMCIEALADGGVRAGLPRTIAHSLAAQTVLGAAAMVQETGKHPGQLKDAVASPGGTTIAGIHQLESAGLRAGLMDAVFAAANRSTELSKTS